MQCRRTSMVVWVGIMALTQMDKREISILRSSNFQNLTVSWSWDITVRKMSDGSCSEGVVMHFLCKCNHRHIKGQVRNKDSVINGSSILKTVKRFFSKQWSEYFFLWLWFYTHNKIPITSSAYVCVPYKHMCIHVHILRQEFRWNYRTC